MHATNYRKHRFNPVNLLAHFHFSIPVNLHHLNIKYDSHSHQLLWAAVVAYKLQRRQVQQLETDHISSQTQLWCWRMGPSAISPAYRYGLFSPKNVHSVT